MFEKLEKATYPQLITEKMRELILERKLDPGDQLPSERELAEQFGVSRASIREAISALIALGFVEARTGTGTYVSTNLTDSVLQPLSWAVLLGEGIGRELAEARKVIEPAVAALAAQRATAADKEELLRTVNSMREAIGEPSLMAEADLKFHMALAKAARNQVLLETMTGLQRLLQSLIVSHLLEDGNQTLCLQEHIEIYGAIEAGDADKAQQAMATSIDGDLC